MAPTKRWNSQNSDVVVDAIVLSDAGKPIFSTFRNGNTSDSGNSDNDAGDFDLVRICGLLQAVRTSVEHNDLGDIQSLRAGSLLLVFQSVGSILLVAVSRTKAAGAESQVEMCLRLRLEYLYGQIIFTLTDHVQSIFAHNPGFDLRDMLGNDSALRTIFDETGETPARYLTAAIPMVYPLSAEAREEASMVLKRVGDETKNTVFALLFVQSDLVVLVQSSYQPHQIRATDMHLLLNFLSRQPTKSELWLPICLPRFNASGFLHCYAHRLTVESNLSLALISQEGSTEQFQSFRAAALRVRRQLGIPVEPSNVLEILCTTNNRIDVDWRRSTAEDAWTSSSLPHYDQDDDDDYEMIPYQVGDDEASFPRLLLGELDALRHSADNPSEVSFLLKEYLQIGVLHFVLRRDIPITEGVGINTSNNHRRPNFAVISQCICSPVNDMSGKNLWEFYERLHLRLLLGSATFASIYDAYDNVADGKPEKGDVLHSRDFATMKLMESPPTIQAVSYAVENSGIHLAMNGKGFELWVLVIERL
jgi:First Longin domain of FUZ, MON1 and HPS1/Second Longin domain of FUZ, MON1 and HPS1